MAEGQSQALKTGDWVLMGKEPMMFYTPGEAVPEASEDLETVFGSIEEALD